MSKTISIASDEVFQSINHNIGIAIPDDATISAIYFSNDGITWADAEYDEGQGNFACIPGQYFKVTFSGVDNLNVLL